MAHKNFRMLWHNRAFDAAALTAGSAASGYPVSCLQDPFRSRRWRSTGVIGEQVSIDFGSSIDFNALAFIDHNLSVTGTIRIMASETPGGNDLLDQNVSAFVPMIGYGEAGYGDWGYGGTLLEADRAWYVPNPIRIVYREDAVKYGAGVVFGGGTVYGQPLDPAPQIMTTARYVTIEFNDPDNPDGYIELGRLFLCRYADFGLNFANIRHGVIDESEITRSLGGQPWVTKKVFIRRTVSLTFNTLYYADKYWNLKLAVEKQGITEQFLIDCFPSPDKPSQNHHSILYGRFQDLPEIEQNYDNGWSDGMQVSSTEITFEEEIT